MTTVVSLLGSTQISEMVGSIFMLGLLPVALLPPSAPNTSFVADEYCADDIVHNTTTRLDFDCLRNATSSSASVKALGAMASADACARYTYRGLPCRAWTYFAPGYARPQFGGRCFGRVDDGGTTAATGATPDAGATSGALALPACSADAHCEFNGACDLARGACACHPGWRGAFCQTLDLAPAAPRNGYRRANYSSWGGSVAYDAARGVWLMFAAEIDGHCGLNEWYLLSRIVRAVATAEAGPEGPYAFEEVVVDRLGHQPTLAYDAFAKQWLMFHQGAGGNCSAPSKDKCVNGSTPGAVPDFGSHSLTSMRLRQQQQQQQQRVGVGAGAGAPRLDCMANMVMRTANLSGAWSAQVEAGIPDNPTAVVLANGSALLLGRGFGSSTVTGFVSTINLQASPAGPDGWKGPYDPVGGGGGDGGIFPDLPAPGWEDGFAWRRADGTFHAIFHGMTRQNLTWACAGQPADLFPGAQKVLPCPEPRFHASPWVGRHAWSADGVTWAYSPYAAFGSEVQFTDGTTGSFARRERPHLIVDDEGNPTHLINGIQPGGFTGDYSYTLVQPTTHGTALKKARAAAKSALK